MSIRTDTLFTNPTRFLSRAGGVVIAPTRRSDICPRFAEPDGEGHGRNPVTQFDKDDVEAVGLVKFDFLGLRTLTIIDWAVKAINGRKAGMGNGGNGESTATISHRSLHSPHSPHSMLDITTIPLDDATTYKLSARGETVEVIQFESRGMRELLQRAPPDRFEDLIALTSLFRRGPTTRSPNFNERTHGPAEAKS